MTVTSSPLYISYFHYPLTRIFKSNIYNQISDTCSSITSMTYLTSPHLHHFFPYFVIPATSSFLLLYTSEILLFSTLQSTFPKPLHLLSFQRLLITVVSLSPPPHISYFHNPLTQIFNSNIYNSISNTCSSIINTCLTPHLHHFVNSLITATSSFVSYLIVIMSHLLFPPKSLHLLLFSFQHLSIPLSLYHPLR